MEADLNQKKGDQFQKIFFFILGVSSLSGWNAVLAGLNFFNTEFSDLNKNIFFIFPIPNFIALTLIGISLPRLSTYLSLQVRILWALILLSALLILLPTIAALMKQTEAGFWLCLVVIFLMGIFGGFQQNSSIGMAGLLGGQYVNIFFLGTGASGTIICLFRFISLAAFNTKQGYSALLYCGVAAVWNIAAAFMFLKFKNTKEYRKILKAHQKGKQSVLVHNEIITDENEVTNSMKQSDVIDSEITLPLQEESGRSKGNSVMIEKMNIFHTLIWINKLAFPIPLMILFLYIQTFMMFPGVAFQKQFDSDFNDWGQNLINFGYNLGDTVGKFMAGKRSLYSQNICLALIVIRFLFFISYFLIANGTIAANWISYLNTFGFATFNGFITTGLMVLGPEKVKEGFVKEKVGFISGFSLQLGITLGTFLALMFS